MFFKITCVQVHKDCVYLIINHKNGNKLGNNIGNLEWVTASENVQHAVDTGLLNTRIRIVQYDINNNKIKEWSSLAEIEKNTKFRRTSISQVCKGMSICLWICMEICTVNN